MVTNGIKVKKPNMSQMPKSMIARALASGKKTRKAVRANIANKTLPDIPLYISSNI